MSVKIDVGALLREVQHNIEEIEIYRSIFQTVGRDLDPVQNLVPIHLPPCSIEKAQSIAKSMGFQIVVGTTGRNYLGWAKVRTPEDLYNDAH